MNEMECKRLHVYCDLCKCLYFIALVVGIWIVDRNGNFNDSEFHGLYGE